MSSKVENSVEFTDIGAAAARHEASNDDNNNTKSPQNGPSAAASSEYRVNGSDSETAHASAGSRVSSRIVEVHIDDAPSLEPHSIWSYNQALRYFLDEQDDAVDSTTTDERAAIAKPAKKRGCFCCFEKGYRFAEAENEERAVLSIVARGFEVNRSVPEQHRRIVETIYFHLTGEHWVSEKQALQEEKMQAPDDLSDIRRSSWEDIGFQGENPGTDLRSAGMFSMLQMLWICEKQPGFLEGLFELSRHPQLGFPLMLVGINTTLVCVQALKAKKLFDVCNATESVIDGVNELYFGLLQHLQRIWEERQLTVMDFQATLEELRTIANSRCVGPGKQSKKLCPCSPTECLTGSFCSIVCYPCAALVLHVNVRTAQKAWWGTETVRARYQTTPDVWVLAVAACLLCDNNFGFLARDASDTAPQTVPKRGHNQSKSLIMNLKF